MDVSDEIFDRKSQTEFMTIGFGEDWQHDPVYEEDGAWFFLDETWANSHGPFETEQEAREELKRYCVECLGENVE